MFWNYGSQIIAIVIGLLQVKLFSNWLNVESYGEFAEFNAILGFISILLSLNLGHSYIRFGAGASTNNRMQYFWTIIFTQFVLVLIGYFLVLIFSKYSNLPFNILNKVYILPLLFIMVSLTLMIGQLLNNYVVSGNYKGYAKKDILIKLLIFLGALCMGFFTKSIVGIIGGFIIGRFISVVFLFIKERSILKNPQFKVDKLKKMLHFGIPLLITVLSYWFITSGNRLIISHYLGHKSLGQFAVLMTFPSMITMSYTALNSIFLSSLSKHYSNSLYFVVNNWMKNIYELYAVLSITICFSGFISSEQIVILISSEEYVFDGLKWVFLIGGLNSVFHGLLTISLRQYDLEVLPIRSLINSIIVMIISFTLSIFLIKWVGISGCLIANIIAFSVGLLILKNQKFANIKLKSADNKIVVLILISFIISYLIDLLISDTILVRIIFSFITATVIGIIGYKIGLIDFRNLFVVRRSSKEN